MIRRLRLKFVAICMALVTMVLGVVFVSVYSAARRGIEAGSMQVLQRVIRQDSLSPLLPGKNEDLQLPYFTVQLVGTDSAYVIGGTYYELDNTAVLGDILKLCLQDGQKSGTIDSYNLRYLRLSNGFSQRIAFVDITMEQSTLRELMRASLQIGGVSLLILLSVSILLAWWATRPVEKAMVQQKQFLSDASHELKTPLTVILSNAELMERTDLPEKQARWADNIHAEAERMQTLVEEMLTLARADTGGIRSAIQTRQDFSELVTDCVLAFQPVAFEAGKDLEDDIAPGLAVLGDGDKLRRLVAVLLDNGVKYGAAGAPVGVTLRRDAARARLQVENQGEPIPPEQLARLFERFYRADASRGEREGFGLGLPIAAAIVAEHRGTLRAESDA
ncbi:MAG: HAMP domain-containing sensor histidine kinase, partial [Oscillospiraceae bacterium]